MSDRFEQAIESAPIDADSMAKQMLNVPLAEFVFSCPDASVRLVDTIRSASHDDLLPFLTVQDYLNAGSTAGDRMLVLPGLGRTSLAEFGRLISNLPLTTDQHNGLGDSTSETGAALLKLPDDFNTPLLAFLEEQMSVSARLRNVIRVATSKGYCPFASVAEYVRAGRDGILRLRKLPSLGTNSAEEFDRLVQSALAAGSIVPKIRQRKAVVGDGFPHLGSLVETVFAALNSVEKMVILARLQDKQTLEQVGIRLDVTRERVRQIEAKALRRIFPVYNVLLQDTAVAIHRVLCDTGRGELMLAEFARMGSCRAQDVLLFLELLRKTDTDEAKLFDWVGQHAYLSDRFIAHEEWNQTIKHLLLSAKWPVSFSELMKDCPLVPEFYVVDNLRKNYGAEIDGREFRSFPQLSTHDMCIIALRNAGGPIHLSDLRASIIRKFGIDLAEHTIAAHVSRLKEAAICDPGTYVHYENTHYTGEILEKIRNVAYAYLVDQGNFVSSKVIFDRLFASQLQIYPEDFNYYLMMGIVQADDRFVTKRGNMVGLSTFDLGETYISLEDEVLNLVHEQGPISIPEIMAKLSTTRRLCNDTGIRLILSQAPLVVRVGSRIFDSVRRFFKEADDYDDYILAIKISLMVRAKGTYALAEDLTALGFSQATLYVVESLLNMIEHTTVNETHSLTALDIELATYKSISGDCLTAGFGRDEIVRRLTGTAADLRSDKLCRLDRRFCQFSSTGEGIVRGSELGSILTEFGF